MADYTENLNLKKPARTDYFSVADFNGNADIIDTAVGDIDAALDGKLNTDFSNISGGAIPIANGGTGATTASDALSNLGITTALSNKADKDLSNITGTLPIANGGTGATTAANALTNLGIDTALNNKANTDLSNVTGTLPIANGGTGNTTGYVTAGQRAGTTLGNKATCEGEDTIASGEFAHAEGEGSRATGTCSHAEGGNARFYTKASGQYSHAEGLHTTASGNPSHAEGAETTASGEASHAEGDSTTASGSYSHAEGYHTTASGDYSHAGGCYTTANYYQTVVGRFNVEKGSTSSYTSGSGYLIVGCGTTSSAKANCFRATESNTYGLTYNSSGADYAEMFEWEDGNISNEDRIGKFVTLDGDKIKLATSQDDYILGVVSGNPSIIGDSHDDQWAGMFEKDIYGRPVYEKVTIPEEKDEEGNIISPETINDQLKVSDKYKNDEEYIPRSKRPEWTAVGLLGKLICIDDGTAEINGYVRPNENSIATHAEEKTKYRVMKRIDETHIQILIL